MAHDGHMGTVTPLALYREARELRERIDDVRGFHPSLRWIAGREYTIAHSRRGKEAGCGAPGPLFLAPPGVPLCGDCFPRDDKSAFPVDE